MGRLVFEARWLGMGRLLCLLAGPVLEASAWHLFRAGPLPGSGYQGDACGSVPISSLRRPEDFAVGTLEDDAARAAVPQCPVKDGATASQAGGHAGAFQVLENGQVAKISKAFQRPGDSTGYLERHVNASAVEWRAYMEMWCLRRLLEQPDNESLSSVWEMQQLEEHPLMPFVTGGAMAWAPQFYGICRLDDGHQLFYMVLDDLMHQFNKPCQMDVKLGYMTGEPDYSWKHIRHQVVDMLTPSATHAARVVGYKAWDPVNNKFTEPASKHSASVVSLRTALTTFMDAVPDPLLTFTLDALRPSKDMLIRMAAWWHDNGIGVLDTIGMSVLMVFECAPTRGVPTPRPLLKLIDFAHLYPHSEHEGWPDNGIDVGMISLARQLARQMVRLAAQHGTDLPEQGHGAKKVSAAAHVECPAPQREILLTRADCALYGQQRGTTFVTWSQTGFLHLAAPEAPEGAGPKGKCRVCDGLVAFGADGLVSSGSSGDTWEVYRLG